MQKFENNVSRDSFGEDHSIPVAEQTHKYYIEESDLWGTQNKNKED